MLSATYRQSSKCPLTRSPTSSTPTTASTPTSPLQRLDAEQLRDSILFVAGDLDGPQGWVAPPSPPRAPPIVRRTVYAKVSRFRIDQHSSRPLTFPTQPSPAEQRFSTNVPVQRLYFMNNAFVFSQAGKLAERVYPDPERRLPSASRGPIMLLFGAQPTRRTSLPTRPSTSSSQHPEKPGYLVDQEPDHRLESNTPASLFSSNEFEFLN